MSDEKSPRDSAPFLFSRMMREPRILLVVAGFYIGAGMIVLPFLPQTSVLELLQRYAVPAVGMILLMACAPMLQRELRRLRGREHESFLDVDRRGGRADQRLEIILDRLREVESKASGDVDYEKIREIVTDMRPDSDEIEAESLDSFSSYFASLVSTLQKKASNADEKASILLDKGTAYSRWGIAFFLVSIVGWQIVAVYTEFTAQHIYGIVSCSLLFAFIEFLSAWFLRQYRHFVDTSTYLIKVKSIFDRYMLTYLAMQQATPESFDEHNQQLERLTKILREDIRWPDDHIFKRGDVSFAKEALESAASVLQAARGKKTDDS